jgi:pyruvate/2-oxoglutarate dehydrogenase complex dihydrolipoamide dehydrogenase (E3) component
MSNSDYDIGIIGGGAAGLTIASGAAQLGARVILIEQEKKLGAIVSTTAVFPVKP